MHRDAGAGQGHASKCKCRKMQYGSDARCTYIRYNQGGPQVPGRAIHRDASADQGHASKCKCRKMQHGSDAFILDASANAATLTTSIKLLMKGSDFLAVHFTKKKIGGSSSFESFLKRSRVSPGYTWELPGIPKKNRILP